MFADLNKIAAVAAVGSGIAGTALYVFYIRNFFNPSVQAYNDAYFKALEIRMKEDRIKHVERVQQEQEYMLQKIGARYELVENLDFIVGKEAPVAEAAALKVTMNPLFSKWRPVGVNEKELPWITYNPYNAPLFFDPSEGKGTLQEISILADK